MDKIPTIFVRDFSNHGKITQEWHPDCLWVRDGEGVPTIKWDGTSCLWKDGKLFKRNKDEGWLPVGDGPEDQWHRDALTNDRFMHCIKVDGTYELCGPKVNGNKQKLDAHYLIKHGDGQFSNPIELTYDGIGSFLKTIQYEGIVWHHPDGRMAKIKRRDYGERW